MKWLLAVQEFGKAGFEPGRRGRQHQCACRKAPSSTTRLRDS